MFIIISQEIYLLRDRDERSPLRSLTKLSICQYLWKRSKLILPFSESLYQFPFLLITFLMSNFTLGVGSLMFPIVIY